MISRRRHAPGDRRRSGSSTHDTTDPRRTDHERPTMTTRKGVDDGWNDLSVRRAHLQRGEARGQWGGSQQRRPGHRCRPALAADQMEHLDRYWHAANYLTVGQIYLQENPLLREPLRPEHIKPRLLGHWGTSPGLSFIYVASEPADPGARCRRDLPGRPGPRRPGAASPTSTWKGRTRRSTRRSRRTRRACGASSASSRRRAASPATSACRRPARSTRAASSATCCRTPSARPSTTRT